MFAPLTSGLRDEPSDVISQLCSRLSADELRLFFWRNTSPPGTDMSEINKQAELEIAHVLLIDVVGYSKLLVNEQIELLQDLNQIVRSSECFRAAEQKVNWSGCRPETGWRFFSSTVRKSRCDVRSRSAGRCKSIRISSCGW